MHKITCNKNYTSVAYANLL